MKRRVPKSRVLERRQSARATEDFRAIFRYGYVTWGPLAAFDYLQSFDIPLAMIMENPRIARARPDLGTGIRSRTHRSHVIVYRVQPDHVLIVRILHGAMDAPARVKGDSR